MKFSGLWVLFVVVGTAFLFIGLGSSRAFHDMVFADREDSATLIQHNRKLKEKFDPSSSKMGGTENFNVEDYPLIDPVPSSKATIHHKPIAHGSPLMPYIPRPTPPAGPPRNGHPGGPY